MDDKLLYNRALLAVKLWHKLYQLECLPDDLVLLVGHQVGGEAAEAVLHDGGQVAACLPGVIMRFLVILRNIPHYPSIDIFKHLIQILFFCPEYISSSKIDLLSRWTTDGSKATHKKGVVSCFG